jgi:hypothetical protein
MLIHKTCLCVAAQVKTLVSDLLAKSFMLNISEVAVRTVGNDWRAAISLGH